MEYHGLTALDLTFLTERQRSLEEILLNENEMQWGQKKLTCSALYIAEYYHTQELILQDNSCSR